MRPRPSWRIVSATARAWATTGSLGWTKGWTSWGEFADLGERGTLGGVAMRVVAIVSLLSYLVLGAAQKRRAVRAKEERTATH